MNKKFFPSTSKRKNLMIKYSDIINPKYCYMKLIPSSAIKDYDSSSLSLLAQDLFKTIKDRIHYIERHFFKEEKTSIRYMINISKDIVSFYYVIPNTYKTIALDTIAKIWNGKCTVQIINKEDLPILDNPTIYQGEYKYEDSLSIRTDKRSNIFLSKSLSIIEILEDDESVQLVVNLMPYRRDSSSWKTYCDDIYDRYKKNLPLHKKKFSTSYIFDLLIAIMGELSNLIIPEALRSTVDFSIAGNTKKLSDNSLAKAKSSKNIIDTQIAILTKSNEKPREDMLAKSFSTSFRHIKEDNELVFSKINSKKSDISIFNHDWNATVNKMSVDELSNIITIAGKTILNEFKNIEHIATKQVEIVGELSKGITPLGTQTHRNKEIMQFLNEKLPFALLPILILTRMGGGKSSWLENVGVHLMNYYRENKKKGINVPKESLFCIDFIKQNEMSYNIMYNLDPEDIIIIDLSTEKGTSQLGFSFLEADLNYDDDRERVQAASRQAQEMMKLIDDLNNNRSAPLTSQMTRYLYSAFLICYIHKNQSLKNAIDIVEDYETRHKYIDMIPPSLKGRLNEEITALLELDDENKTTKHKLISGITARFFQLRSDPTLKEMYNAKPEDGVNFTKEMQNGKAIFVLIPDDLFHDSIINTISTYIVTRLFFACQKRGTLPSKDVTRCTLIIDEINLAPDTLPIINSMIGRFRKYKLRPIISAHNFEQLKVLKKNLSSSGASVILPQGSAKENYLEFQNNFKQEGFFIEDFNSLDNFQSLNLIGTSKGKKAFISQFPPPVPGKIEDRDDITLSEFKNLINKKIDDYQNKQKKSNSKSLNSTSNKNTNSKDKNKSKNIIELKSSKTSNNSIKEKLTSNTLNLKQYNKIDNKNNGSKQDTDTLDDILDLNDNKYNDLFEEIEKLNNDDEFII